MFPFLILPNTGEVARSDGEGLLVFQYSSSESIYFFNLR